MRGGSARPARTRAELDRVAVWVAGGCAPAAAAVGFFVGFAYTLDQGDPAFAVVHGALGPVVGAVLGLLDAMAPVVALAAVKGR